MRERSVLHEHCDFPGTLSPLSREQPQSSGILHKLPPPRPSWPLLPASPDASTPHGQIVPQALIKTMRPFSLRPQESDPTSHPQTQPCLRVPNDPRLAGAEKPTAGTLLDHGRLCQPLLDLLGRRSRCRLFPSDQRWPRKSLKSSHCPKSGSF